MLFRFQCKIILTGKITLEIKLKLKHFHPHKPQKNSLPVVLISKSPKGSSGRKKIAFDRNTGLQRNKNQVRFLPLIIGACKIFPSSKDSIKLLYYVNNKTAMYYKKYIYIY